MDRARSVGLTAPEYVWIGTSSVVESHAIETADKNLPQGMLGLRTLSPSDSLNGKVKVPRAAIMISAVKLWMDGVARYYKAESGRKLQLAPMLSCTSNDSFWEDGQKLYRRIEEGTLPKNLNFPIKSSPTGITTVTALPVSFNKDGVNNNVTLEIINLGRRRAWRKIGYWNSPDVIELDDITWPGNAAKPPDGKPEKIFLRITTHDEMPYVNYLPPDPVTGQCSSIGAVRVRMTNATGKDCPECIGNSSTYFSCATGFCIDLLQRLKADINFDFEMFHVRDDKWGIANQNNEWNGVVRDLIDGVADLSMTSLKVAPDRVAAIDFSVPFLETGITILVSVRQGAVSPTAFLEPYEYTVWVMVGAAGSFLAGITIFVYEILSPAGFHHPRRPRKEPYDYPTWLISLFVSVNLAGVVVFITEYYSPLALNRGANDGGHRFSLFRSLWLIWAILFSAAVKTDSTKGLASRFMTAVWALFSLVFLASYTANLAAFMITKEDYFNFEGIQDIKLTQPYTLKPPLRFATVPDGSTAINLKKYYPDMYSYMSAYNKNSIKDGISALRANEIHAFIYDATVLDYYANHDETCKLKTVGNWYAMTGYAIGFPKGSKYKDQFNVQLLKYINEGYLDRLRNFWLVGACKKSEWERQSGSSQALEVINFTSAYILLAAGVVLAAVLLTCEHLYFRCCRRRLREVDKWDCCQLISLSMGKSLTFEASVMDVIDKAHHRRCRDELCNSQLWHLRHELDLAVIRIEKLRQMIPRHINHEQTRRLPLLPLRQQSGGKVLGQVGTITEEAASHEDGQPGRDTNQDQSA